MFGKALGNGYAITSVICREFLRDKALSSFISSTFWTERIGYVAALASLNRMEELDAPYRVSLIGTKIKAIWEKASHKSELDINISGLDALAGFSFVHSSLSLHLKSLFTKTMLEKGFIAPTAVYASLAHTEELLDKYEIAVIETFLILAEQLKMGESHVLNTSKDVLCHDTFKRLN